MFSHGITFEYLRGILCSGKNPLHYVWQGLCVIDCFRRRSRGFLKGPFRSAGCTVQCAGLTSLLESEVVDGVHEVPDFFRGAPYLLPLPLSCVVVEVRMLYADSDVFNDEFASDGVAVPDYLLKLEQADLKPP